MNTRILAAIGLLALCLLLLFWFRSPEETSGRQAEGLPETVADDPAPEPAQAVAELEPPLVIAEPEAEARETRQVAPAEPSGKVARTWPEEETRWIDVQLVLPEGTPREEQPWVMALDEDGDHGDIYGRNGPFVALHEGEDPLLVDAVLSAAESDSNGAARIGLPPDVEEAWLAVGGNYLYSLELHAVDLDEGSGPIELRPVLGAWISGQLLAPPGASVTDVAGVDVRLTWSINASLQLGTAGSDSLNLRTKTDATGAFELRAVPVGKPQTLSTEPPLLAVTTSEDIAAQPGEHVRLEIAPLFGGTMRGRVVDETGAPVAGAAVHALGNEFLGNPTARLRETESDAEGNFELAGVTPGRVWLRARHDDFQDLLSSPFDLADREDHDHGDVVLVQGLFIAGRVLFPDGSPATGARVLVIADLSENVAGSPVDPHSYIGVGNDDTVDDEGAFRVTGLGPGPWSVTTQLVVDEELEGGPAFGRWSATRDTVRAPFEELTLTLLEPVHVKGVVVDGEDQPVTGFTIHAARAGSQWYMPPSEERDETFESEDGHFQVSNLRSGDWTFTAVAEGYARSAEVTLELPTEEQLALVLLRPVRLAGKVLDPDGRLVAGAEVSKELEGTEVFEAMQGRGDWPVAKSNSEGNFVLEDLAPGTGSVLAKKDGFAPSAAQPFELAEGEQRGDLVLALRRGGTISGEVYDGDGKPAGGCMIIVQMPTLQERRFTNTEADGTFAESGLTPGTWQVQAFPGIESLQSEDGGAIDQGKLLAVLEMTTVELADEAEEHVVLGELPENPVRVHGRVTLDNAPVSESMISFVPASGGGIDLLKIMALEEDGSYALQLDEPGDYLVTIQTTSTPGRQNSIEFRRSVPSGENYRLDFEMPLGRVSGRVRGPDGEPRPQARVTLNMEGGLVFGTVFGGQYDETVTDEDGNYEILYLRPGRYAVAAGGARFGGFLGGDEGLGREVESIEVAEGQWVRGLDFRLEEPGSISGTIRDATGSPVTGASIFVRDDEGHLVELFSLAQTNASGSFEFPGLAPGDYTVTARTSALSSSGDTPVRVRPGESSEVTVVVNTGTTLLVSLVDKSGADVPSRVSVLDAAGREMNGMLGLAEIMERYSGGLGNSVQRVGPLPPGVYKVRAFAEDGRSTKRSVTVRGKPEKKVRLRLE